MSIWNSSRKVLLVFILSFTLLSVPSVLNAMGFGVGGYFGWGDYSFTSKPYLLPERQTHGSINRTGVAFIFDSNLAGANPYSFRFNFNIEKADLQSGDFNSSESLICFNFDAAFLIGLIRQTAFRIWIGPDIRLGIAKGNGSDFTKDVLSNVTGFGALIGTNIHLGDNFDLSLAAGVRYEIYNTSSQYGTNATLRGNAAYAYLMAIFFFRTTDDKYDAGI